MHICQWCGQSFDLAYRRSGAPRFCSRVCANQYIGADKNAGAKAVRRCDACGKGFRPNHSHGQRFCSRECWSLSRPGPKPKPQPSARSCSECGAEYTGNRGKYCGYDCAASAKLRRDREYRSARPKPPPEPVVVVSVPCWVCGDDMLVPEYRAHKRYCSRRCRKAALNGHKERAQHHGVEYQPVIPRTIYERDDWVCGLCGDPVDPMAKWPDQMCASLDHVVPISQGGPHRPDNLRLAHWLCNSYRGVDDIDFRIA